MKVGEPKKQIPQEVASSQGIKGLSLTQLK